MLTLKATNAYGEKIVSIEVPNPPEGNPLVNQLNASALDDDRLLLVGWQVDGADKGVIEVFDNAYANPETEVAIFVYEFNPNNANKGVIEIGNLPEQGILVRVRFSNQHGNTDKNFVFAPGLCYGSEDFSCAL